MPPGVGRRRSMWAEPMFSAEGVCPTRDSEFHALLGHHLVYPDPVRHGRRRSVSRGTWTHILAMRVTPATPDSSNLIQPDTARHSERAADRVLAEPPAWWFGDASGAHPQLPPPLREGQARVCPSPPLRVNIPRAAQQAHPSSHERSSALVMGTGGAT